MAAFFQCKQRRGFYKEVLPKWVIILPSKWIIKKIMIYYNKGRPGGRGEYEMYKSATYGDLEITQIPEKIREYYERMEHYDTPFQMTVGTDSQNFDTLKVVNVIAVICEGHGGIFFYEITRLPRTNDVRQKLTTETNESLQATLKLTEIMENEEYKELRENLQISIHIDAGWSPNGKTKELIPGLVGWIKACGYDCEVKPDAFVASTIADKISK